MTMTLKAARINRGLTQAEAAEKLGVSLCKVRNWETGRSIPKLKDVSKIEDVYQVKYADLKFF